MWTDAVDDEQNIESTRGVWKAMQPVAKEAVYANDLDQEGNDLRDITSCRSGCFYAEAEAGSMSYGSSPARPARMKSIAASGSIVG